jgi:hypothetical protein
MNVPVVCMNFMNFPGNFEKMKKNKKMKVNLKNSKK